MMPWYCRSCSFGAAAAPLAALAAAAFSCAKLGSCRSAASDSGLRLVAPADPAPAPDTPGAAAGVRAAKAEPAATRRPGPKGALPEPKGAGPKEAGSTRRLLEAAGDEAAGDVAAPAAGAGSASGACCCCCKGGAAAGPAAALLAAEQRCPTPPVAMAAASGSGSGHGKSGPAGSGTRPCCSFSTDGGGATGAALQVAVSIALGACAVAALLPTAAGSTSGNAGSCRCCVSQAACWLEGPAPAPPATAAVKPAADGSGNAGPPGNWPVPAAAAVDPWAGGSRAAFGGAICSPCPCPCVRPIAPCPKDAATAVPLASACSPPPAAGAAASGAAMGRCCAAAAGAAHPCTATAAVGVGRGGAAILAATGASAAGVCPCGAAEGAGPAPNHQPSTPWPACGRSGSPANAEAAEGCCIKRCPPPAMAGATGGMPWHCRPPARAVAAATTWASAPDEARTSQQLGCRGGACGAACGTAPGAGCSW